MSQLIIGNQLTEETGEGAAALPVEYRQFLSVISHRMLWFARDGDIVVLPTRPASDFVAYVRRLMGLSDGEPRIVVPPPGRQGPELLYDDRLADPEFLAEVRPLIEQRRTDRVFPFYLDKAVLCLARELGLGGPAGGLAFLAERGGEIVNSKAVFRAIAAGNGVPIPDGLVCTSRADAEAFAWPLLAKGRSVIVKQDLHGGGYGNELLVPSEGVTGVGASATIVVPDRAALADHLAGAWERYSYGGARPVVVEHYLHGCEQLYIEFLVTGDAAQVIDYGQIRMKPILNGLVIPPPVADLPGFLTGARKLAEAQRLLGYRGYAGIDAIRTPAGDILFNELNGRVAGSTHLDTLARRMVGEDYLERRVLISRNRCRWPSFTAAEATLAEHGLAFDPAAGTGILLPGDDDAPGGPTGQILAVGADITDAQELEDRAVAAFGLSGDGD
jgi:hypothetical protein